MANKRILKRNIHLICDDLFAECVAASLYGQNRDSAESLIYSTIKLQRDFISRVSHPEPGMKASLFFKNLKEDFINQVSEIDDQISNF